MRHALGAVLGLVLLPALFLMLIEMRSAEVLRDFDLDGRTGVGPSVPVLAVGVAAAVAALLTGVARVSPVAAVVVGLPFAVAGVLFFVDPTLVTEHLLRRLGDPVALPSGTLTMSAFLVLGLALLFSALPPGRWRRPTAVTAVRPGGPRRHVTGAVLGAVLAPLLFFAVTRASADVGFGLVRAFDTRSGMPASAMALLVLAAALVALAAAGGYRVPPVAALVAGAPLAVTGVLVLLGRDVLFDVMLPLVGPRLARGADTFGGGACLSIGLALLLSAAPPGRWRRPAPAPEPAPEPAPAPGPAPAREVSP